jgi:hypothetical protein
MPTRSRIAPKRSRAFSVKAFLESGGVARRVVEFRRPEVVFAQGIRHQM